MQIITNRHWYPIRYGCELPEKIQAEFDYYSPEDLDSALFVQYRGTWYDVGEFTRIEQPVAPHPQREGWEDWHGYHGETFFSTVLIRFNEEGDLAQMGTAVS